MGTPPQSDHDLFRILLYRNDATELLFETTSDGLGLPAVRVPANTRAAEEITAAIKILWNLETYCLFSLPSEGAVRYQVAELYQSKAGCPAGMQWLPVLSLSAGAFDLAADFAAIRNSMKALNQYRLGEIPGAFGKTGWLRTITEWVAAQAAATGLNLTGAFHQFNASPTFSLIRFETDGPALWFKAAGEPNLREYAITVILAKLFPAFVPRVIATNLDWTAWLTTEAEGTHPDVGSELQTWITIANRLADLQLASFGQSLRLTAAGCRDVRPSSLVKLVDPFLDMMAGLMQQQRKASPEPLSPQELRTLGAQLQEMLSHFSASSIPNALGQLDLNPGNILVGNQQCVFLDWAEACVGHPFITCQYLLEHMRRLGSTDHSWEAALTSSYVDSWRTFIEPEEISADLAASALLAAFAYACAGEPWRNPERLAHPDTARHLRSVTRRMKREADRWAIARPGPSLCQT
jgi:hypothetical protein